MHFDTYQPLGQELDRGGALDADALSDSFRNALSDEGLDECGQAYRMVAAAFEEAGTASGDEGAVFTVHDAAHIRGVLALLGQLCQAAPFHWRRDKRKIDDLVLGAIAHDVGMATSPRHEHGPAGATWVKRELADLLPEPERRARIGSFCSHHPSSADLSTLRDPNLAEMVSLVRLADALHLGPSRAPVAVYEALWHSADVAHESKLHWTLNRTVTIEAPMVWGGARTLQIQPIYPDERLVCVPDFMRAHVQAELDSIQPFAPAWLACRAVNLERLPGDREAWGEWVGRVLHAAAVLYCKRALEMESSGALVDYLLLAVDLLTWSGDATAPPEELDRIIEDILLHTGGRPQLNSLRRLAGLVTGGGEEPASSSLKDRAAAFRGYRDSAVEMVGEEAVSTITGLPAWANLFAFGFGKPMRATLERLGRLHPGTVTVWTSLVRPLGEGQALKLHQSRESLPGITVEVAPAAQTMWAIAQTDAVIMGCEAIYANGDVLNSSGCHQIAVAARALGKPLFVLTDSLKLPVKGAPGAPQIPTMAATMFVHGEYAKQIVGKARFPIAERLPNELITAVVTELGAFSGEGMVADIQAAAQRREGWPECLRHSI